ncbi:MAG TPA: mechanosensitive ion channel family protein [Terracidiphilus sp.]
MLLSLFLLCSAPAAPQKAKPAKKPASPLAQAAPAASAPDAAPAPPPDPLGRSTPHGCVVGFLIAAQEQDYVLAAQYLDSKKSPDASKELARQLQAVLDQGLSANLAGLSRETQGDLLDNLRNSRELVGTVKTEDGSLDIWLDRVQRPGEAPIWLFSSETLAAIPKVSGELQRPWLEGKFPSWMVDTRVFSLPLWRWTILLASQLLILLVVWLINRLVQALLGRAMRRILPETGHHTVGRLRGPTFILLLAANVQLASRYSFSVLGREYWHGAAVVLAVSGIAWFIVRISDLALVFLIREKSGSIAPERATFLSVAARVFKIVVVLFAFLAILSHAGVNVSAMLAGLGIGGIALALAAQNTLQDFFGGIAITARRAVRVGDSCKIGDATGTVEDIGLSCLKLRTSDRCVVSLPNAKVAQQGIQNLSLRDKFWVHQIVNLRVDTSAEQVSTVLEEINRALLNDDKVEKTSASARLIELDPTGLRVEISAYLMLPPADGARCSAAQEKIILAVLKIIEAAETGLAAPMQTASSLVKT